MQNAKLKTGGNVRAEVARTIRYFDMFDQPVTAVQVWRTLVVTDEPSTRLPRLADVTEALDAEVENGTLGTQWGYYFLARRPELITTRLQRHLLAQLKWKLTRRVARWLQYVPFVRGLAMSGSLAAGNTKPSSDLDIFVITEQGRIWTARLGLLLVSQLLGRRRKYWQGEAPNKVCLNHYVTTGSLTMPPALHNVYTAVLYQWLIPLTGFGAFQAYQAANAGWITKQLQFPLLPSLPNRQLLQASSLGLKVKMWLERLLHEPLFRWTERWAEQIQRWFIERHMRTQSGTASRVVLSAAELAFHPDTKVPSILAEFKQKMSSKQSF